MASFVLNPAGFEWKGNAILNGRAKRYETPEVEGWLSVKSVLSGEGIWTTPEGRYKVTPESYLVLNQGQSYRLEINSPDEAETFCVFFEPGVVEGINGALSGDAASALNEGPCSSTGFFEGLAPTRDSTSRTLAALAGLVKSRSTLPEEVDLAIIRLAESMLKDRLGVVTRIECLAHSKQSVREEVYRRLQIARDYALASLSQPLDLNYLASTAFLSPFHFHRLFKLAYGETPHEFVRRARTQKAVRLLATTTQPLSDICLQSGFASPQTFANYFKREFGVTPETYRRKNRKIE